jgi:hypothetical protein
MPVDFGSWSLSAQVRRIADLSTEDTTVERIRDAIADQGWVGFADLTLLARAVAVLLLASVLGTLIAYHPRSWRTVDRIVDAEAQKAYVMYAAIGALTGMMVLKYGIVVGFVIFGIGGLIRFRTDLRSAPMTGRLILVTLVGLACGLNLPHLAVLATVFTFVLIGVLDANITYHITVKGLAFPTSRLRRTPTVVSSSARTVVCSVSESISRRAMCRWCSERRIAWSGTDWITS